MQKIGLVKRSLSHVKCKKMENEILVILATPSVVSLAF